MSAFADHLAEAARRRGDAGLTRVLSCDHPHGLIDLAGNDYLSLRHDPAVLESATRALQAYGAGAGACGWSPAAGRCTTNSRPSSPS